MKMLYSRVMLKIILHGTNGSCGLLAVPKIVQIVLKRVELQDDQFS
jgi:hypothetical protein